MVTCVVLLDFTQQGIAKYSDTLARSDQFSKSAQKAGVHVKSQFWTTGGHDGVLVLEAADEQAIAAVLLKLGSEGYMRSQTLRAFDRAEVEGILAKAK